MDWMILDPDADCEAWDKAILRLPSQLRDVYFTSSYARMHRVEPDCLPRMFVFNAGGETWLHAFLLQEVPAQFLPDSQKPLYDIESFYGYGGPLATNRDPAFMKKAHAAFEQWAVQAGVIAEFLRFHPLLENQCFAHPAVEVLYQRETVSLDLEDMDEEMVFGHRDARYMARRALKSGLCVYEAEPMTEFEAFLEIYTSTMDRIGADKYYYFNDDYYQELARLTAESGWLLAAKLEERWAAAAIFLTGSSLVHYHLSGANGKIRIPGATNLLLRHAALLGKQAGFTRLHLGGGTSNAPEDPLFKFKRKMGSHTHAFYIGKRVLKPHAYAQVRAKWEHTFPELVEKYSKRILCYRFKG